MANSRAWDARRPSARKPGRQRKYSNHAIETAVTLGMVFHLPSRQTEGFLRGVVARLGTTPELPFATSPHAETGTDSGIPSSVIRLMALTAIAASLFCASSLLARRRSPMICLYRDIAFSARAC